jgi:hypothetical protein
MFENTQINNYTYATRYIASWLREGGQLRYGNDIDKFYKWLLSMGLSKEDADHIKFLATNGKMELEYQARMFLAENK